MSRATITPTTSTRSEFGLGPDELAKYRRDGFVVIRGVLTPAALEEARRECDRLLGRKDLLDAEIPHIPTRRNIHGVVEGDRIEPATAFSTVLRRLSDDPRITGRVASILGQTPRLFKDKLILKPPGVCGYGLHQDYPYWERTGIPTDEVLTAQLALDDADADNGAVCIYPGLHGSRLPSPADAPFDVDEKAIGSARPVLAEMSAGDLLVFHALAPHRSDPNRSDRPRRTVYFIYNAACHGDFFDSNYRDHRRAVADSS